MGVPENSDALFHFDEVEVELLPGKDESHVQAMAAALAARPGLVPVQESKLERALIAATWSVPGPFIDVGEFPADLHIGEVCRMIWHEQIMKIILSEHGVTTGSDIEYVHTMRVAIRRARVAAKLFGPYFHKGALRDYLKNLKTFADLLGDVRDLDIGLENLKRFQKRLAKVERSELKAVQNAWRRRRRQAQHALVSWLRGRKYREFVVDFSRFCRTPGEGVKTSGNMDAPPSLIQARHVFPNVIVDGFARVRSYENLFERDKPVSLENLHSLRVQCKYLRYTLEFARHLMGREGAALIEQLKRLQDFLGNLNDMVVERKNLETWEEDHAADKVIQTRIQELAGLIEEQCAQFPPIYTRFVGEENRRLLAIAVARM